MTVLAIDPGEKQSAWVVYDGEAKTPKRWGLEPNLDVLDIIRGGVYRSTTLVIEKIVGYGRTVGSETFQTIWWYGRFHEAWVAAGRGHPHYITRRQVKQHLCDDIHAKDPNVSRALLDLWGGRAAAFGRKKTPGPLYGMRKDIWSALAVAVTWCETSPADAERSK